jgi:putative transposase
MDKITRQVRIEHWTQIMNECLNSGMNKTEWCRANGISDKQFFYWQRILRKEAFAASTSKELSVIAFYGAQRPPFCFRTAALRSQRPPIF